MFPMKTNAKITITIFIRITRQGFIAWVFGPSTFIASFNQFTVIILAKTEKRNELFSSLKSRFVRDERNLDNMIFQGKDEIHKRCGGNIYNFKLTLAMDTYNYSCKRNLCFAQFLRNCQSTTC